MKMLKVMVSIVGLASSMAFADVFKVDTEASKIEWNAGKKIGSFHNGAIKIKNGDLETDAKGKLKSANIVVDMKTISNDDLKEKPEYQTKLIGHLSSDDFFKVEQFPESTFQLTSVKAKKGDEYTVKGKLTMLGKTENIEFPAKLKIEKDSISGSGKMVIERLKWGLQYGSGSIFKSLTADKIINDTFDLTLNFVAKK